MAEFLNNYLIRVELHGANADDYGKLHNAMAQRGFSRTIRGDDGVVYDLPTAEYAISAYEGNEVRTQASAAADTTGRANGVLVAQYTQACWKGLAAHKN
jgi:hypothetical protein